MRRLTIGLLFIGNVASAHDADVIFVVARPDLSQLVTLTPGTLSLLAPIDADGDGVLSQTDLDQKAKALRAGFWDEVPLSAGGKPCRLLETSAVLKEGVVELRGRWDCPPGPLSQDFRILRVLATNYRVALSAEGEGAPTSFAQGSFSRLAVPRQSTHQLGLGARALIQEFSMDVLAVWAATIWAFARRGRRAAALALIAVALASWLPLPWLPATVLMLAAGGGAVGLRSPPYVLAVLLGAAVGFRQGHEAWIQGAATVLVLAIWSVGVLGFGHWLASGSPRRIEIAKRVSYAVACLGAMAHGWPSW